MSSLSLLVNVHCFAAKEPYRASHPLVLAHPTCFRLLAEAWNIIHVPEPIRFPIAEGPMSLMQHRVEVWFERFLEEGWHWRRSQAYLVGPPGTGKSMAAMRIFNGLKVFIPGSGRFFLHGLNNSYDAILFEDFTYDPTIRRELLSITQGDLLTFDEKHSSPKTMSWHKPIIFTSNFQPNDEAFLDRLEVFHF